MSLTREAARAAGVPAIRTAASTVMTVAARRLAIRRLKVRRVRVMDDLLPSRDVHIGDSEIRAMSAAAARTADFRASRRCRGEEGAGAPVTPAAPEGAGFAG